MRDNMGLYHAKRTYNGKWVEGCLVVTPQGDAYIISTAETKRDVNVLINQCSLNVDPETIGQFTGLTDKNGVRIFEGDIVRYNTFDDFDCQSVVKFGEYNQDGSAGEYSASKCIGFYVDVDNFTCPDWCEYGSNCFSNYLKQQNILEVAQYCEIIGNIHDDPELLEQEDT